MILLLLELYGILIALKFSIGLKKIQGRVVDERMMFVKSPSFV